MTVTITTSYPNEYQFTLNHWVTTITAENLKAAKRAYREAKGLVGKKVNWKIYD